MLNKNIITEIYKKYWKNIYLNILLRSCSLIEHTFYTWIHIITKKINKNEYVDFYYRTLVMDNYDVEYRYIKRTRDFNKVYEKSITREYYGGMVKNVECRM